MNPQPGSHKPMLAGALAYARHGWPVFPCRPGSKEPATVHGHLDATTDPETIRRWWSTDPARNVAVATGAPGPDVLDIDTRPGGSGYPAWRKLQRAGLAVGGVALVRTPSGGLHAYFHGTAQRSGSLHDLHVDFKAAGGYVLAPPSEIRGRHYQLIGGPHGGRPVLDWAVVTRQLRPETARDRWPDPAVQSDPGRLTAWVARLPEGNRNAGLFWAACRAAETGQGQALGALAAAARTAGLPDAEIQRTIASAIRTAGQPGRSPGQAREAAS